jgi:hypothetical protein
MFYFDEDTGLVNKDDVTFDINQLRTTMPSGLVCPPSWKNILLFIVFLFYFASLVDCNLLSDYNLSMRLNRSSNHFHALSNPFAISLIERRREMHYYCVYLKAWSIYSQYCHHHVILSSSQVVGFLLMI